MKFSCVSIKSWVNQHLPKDRWESADARKSWRRVACSRGCGWYVNRFNCSKCGTVIEGDFIQGRGIGQENGVWCFVATACFEDIDHPTVGQLRMFRDLHLSNYRLGQVFIEWYYENGPSYACWVSNKPRVKACLRIILSQLVKILPK